MIDKAILSGKSDQLLLLRPVECSSCSDFGIIQELLAQGSQGIGQSLDQYRSKQVGIVAEEERQSIALFPEFEGQVNQASTIRNIDRGDFQVLILTQLLFYVEVLKQHYYVKQRVVTGLRKLKLIDDRLQWVLIVS